MTHRQSFLVVNYGYNRRESGYSSAAWMNFNNIGIDGSLGDMDTVAEVTPGGQWKKNVETFGSLCMYLMFVHRQRPDLLENKEFLNAFFTQWRHSLGEEIFNLLKTKKTFPIRGLNDTFSVALDAISTYIRWMESPIDIRPNGTPNQTITYTGYLDFQGKDTWVPSARSVVKNLHQNREIVGL